MISKEAFGLCLGFSGVAKLAHFGCGLSVGSDSLDFDGVNLVMSRGAYYG